MQDKTNLISARLQLGTQSIDIGGKGSPYRFLENGIQGVDAPSLTTAMRERAQLDGGVCMAQRVPSRCITLDFEIAQGEDTERLRAALISFFSPTASGVLTVTRGSVTRHIACRLSEGVTFTQPTLYHPVRVHVALICPDPYFYEKEESASLRRGAAGLIWFPLTATEEGGITGGVLGGDHSVSLENEGDGEAGFHLILSVGDGDGYADDACEMSGITVTQRGVAGDSLYINTTVKKGDILEISTIPGAKYVRKNGVACMHFSPESRFFALPRGIVTLDFAFDVLLGLPYASVSFRPRYLGV